MTTVSVPTYSHCRPLAGHESAKIFSAMDSPDPSWKVYLHSKMYLYFRDTLIIIYYLRAYAESWPTAPQSPMAQFLVDSTSQRQVAPSSRL